MEKQHSVFPDEESFSNIMLYCLKRCLNSPQMSTEVKLKILRILYGDDAKLCSGKGFDHSNIEMFNPLGVDEESLDSPCLTGEQGDCLRRLILDEVKKLHNFCLSIRKNVSTPSEFNWMEQADKLYSNIKEEVKGLEYDSNLQNKLENLKLEGCKLPMEMKNDFMKSATQLLEKERSLLLEIDQCLMCGERGNALAKVERILEEKIRANKEKIQKLQFLKS